MRYTTNAPKTLEPAWSWETAMDDARSAYYTDEHPTSSYGLAVLVHQGRPYGPADLPGHVEPWHSDSPETMAWLTQSGWAVEPQPCYCPAYGHIANVDDVPDPCPCTAPDCRCRRRAAAPGGFPVY